MERFQTKYGSVEVFQHPQDYQLGGESDPGWYWWAYSPGGSPNTEHYGPFNSQEEAEANAKLND